MDSENKRFIISLGVFFIIVVAGYAALISYTGLSIPFSTVVSSSMQHSDERSELGIIDTGDVVVVADPSKKEIQSYVVGAETGYQSFGMYGSVIIYERETNKNPVIHRAIVWIDYDKETDTWSSEELAASSLEWHSSNGKDASNLNGTLTIYIEGVPYSINLNNIDYKCSGYLTKGDNNDFFDQNSLMSHLIPENKIISVAIAEIPWIGIIKLVLTGNGYVNKVPNSLPSLLMVILLIFGIFGLLDVISISKECDSLQNKMDICIKRRKRAPHPFISTGTLK